MRSRDHAVLRDDFRARREIMAGDAIAGVRSEAEESGENGNRDSAHGVAPVQRGKDTTMRWGAAKKSVYIRAKVQLSRLPLRGRGRRAKRGG
jgi:hypothetical protein